MPTPAAFREFEDTLSAGLGPDVPSVAYGIWQGGDTVLLGAKGLADRERGIAATPQTPYALASVTKPMTATAIMILAERGLVDLDAPMDGIQSRAGDAREATVRRVANHTTGLPLYYHYYYADESFAPPPFAETARRYAKTFVPPGERHVYSNLGYGMLDNLIAQTLGLPYARYMAEEVFGPLGMIHASVGAPEKAALAYGADGLVYPRFDFDHPGGSSAFASVEDLLAFGAFHLGHGPELSSAEARRGMQIPTFGYGFGWSVTERHGRRIVAHAGGMAGANTTLTLVPELDLVLAVLVNGESPLPYRARDEALAALDPRFREGLAAERAAPAPEGAIRAPVVGGRWVGSVETHAGTIPMELDLDRLVAQLDGNESSIEEIQGPEGRLQGTFDGDLGTEDAGRRPYRVHLDLTLRADVLSGAATAISLPGPRRGNALGYWTELRPL